MEIRFQTYGQNRELNATDEEQKIYQIIYQCTEAKDLEFVRRSSNYVTAAIGLTDVARFKFTKRAKWIHLPYLFNDKIDLTSPEDVFDIKDALIKAVEKARELNG